MATEITLLEIDAPNAQFNAPFSGRGGPIADDRSGAAEGESGAEETGTGGAGPPRALPLLVILGLVVLAVVLRAFRNEFQTDQEPDVEGP